MGWRFNLVTDAIAQPTQLLFAPFAWWGDRHGRIFAHVHGVIAMYHSAALVAPEVLRQRIGARGSDVPPPLR